MMRWLVDTAGGEGREGNGRTVWGDLYGAEGREPSGVPVLGEGYRKRQVKLRPSQGHGRQPGRRELRASEEQGKKVSDVPKGLPGRK